MNNITIWVLRVVIALSLAGSLFVQAVILPLLWVDLEGAPFVERVTYIVIAGLFVLAMQVFAVCVWQLLTRVKKGSVFSNASFGYVNVIIGAVASSSLLTFLLAVLLTPGEVAPGVVGLICGAALVLAGMALLVVVMRQLLVQAIDRDATARALQAELDEVV